MNEQKKKNLSKNSQAKYNDNIEPISIEDFQFNRLIELLLAEAQNTILLSERTIEILDSVLEPIEISKALSKRLSQTMLKAEKHRQYLRQIRYYTSQGLVNDYIALLRKKQNILVRDIALKLGIQENLLKDIESGKTEFYKLGANNLIKLARVLRVPLDEFAGVIKKGVETMLKEEALSLTLTTPTKGGITRKKGTDKISDLKNFFINFEKQLRGLYIKEKGKNPN